MDISQLTPEQVQQLLAAAQANQAPAVQPAPTPVEVAAPVDIDLGDVLGRGAYGPSLFSAEDTVGTSYTGVVAAETYAKQDTDFISKAPKFFKNGDPVPVVVVSLDVPVSERHPEGRATWYSKGRDIAALKKAMQDAGVPRSEVNRGPELGSTLTVTFASTQKSKFGNDAKIRTVVYTRPGVPSNHGELIQAATVPAKAEAPAAEAPVDVAALLAKLGAQQ